jgi:NADH:ubiquinone oxidoreductase subunit K
LILLIISLEIIFISSNFGFILSSLYFDDILGFIFSIFSLTIAGAEVSLGLALAIIMFRHLDNVFIKNLKYLKS